MASVRITGELANGVESRINSEFFKQYEQIRSTLSETFGDRVYAYALRKELKFINALPDSFFKQASNYTALLQHFELPDLKTDLKLTTILSIPYNIANDYSTRMICDNSQLYVEFKTMNDKLIALSKEQNSVRSAIVDGIKSFSTLKKFLSIMPEAEMFIPENALRTHYETTPKKPVAPKLSNENKGLTHEQRVTLAKTKMAGLIQ